MTGEDANLPEPPSGAYLPGTWVRVFGQISHVRVHPEDVSVRLFSHSEESIVDVRRDRVEQVAPPMHLAFRCTSLYRTPKALNDEVLHCRLHEGHSAEHRAVEPSGAPWVWSDYQARGNLDNTWLLYEEKS